MSPVQPTGPGPISPKERKEFEQEYRTSVDLFQKALNQSVKSQNPYQKQQFKEVMQSAMHVLNETARELKNAHLTQQTQQIAKDYQAYQSHPSGIAQQKLNQDLDHAKKAIE